MKELNERVERALIKANSEIKRIDRLKRSIGMYSEAMEQVTDNVEYLYSVEWKSCDKTGQKCISFTFTEDAEIE